MKSIKDDGNFKNRDTIGIAVSTENKINVKKNNDNNNNNNNNNRKERESTREPEFPKIQIRMNDNDDGSQSTRNVKISDKRKRRDSDDNYNRLAPPNDREKRQRNEKDYTDAAPNTSNYRTVHIRQDDKYSSIRGSRPQDETAADRVRREFNIPPNRPLSDSYIPSRDNNGIYFSSSSSSYLLTYLLTI